MKEYDSYLFDVDGTLIDSRELIYQSFLHMAGVMSLTAPSREAVDRVVGIPIDQQLLLFIGEDKTHASYAEGYDIYHEFHMREAHRYLGVFPGVREGLAELRDMGKKLAVVSSRNRNTLFPFLEVLELDDYFPVIVCADDTEKHKPHPEPAIRGLELLDADASASVFVGDAEFDMACGKGAGMDVAYVAWGGMDYSAWPVKPDFAAAAFRDLLPDVRG